MPPVTVSDVTVTPVPFAGTQSAPMHERRSYIWSRNGSPRDARTYHVPGASPFTA